MSNNIYKTGDIELAAVLLTVGFPLRGTEYRDVKRGRVLPNGKRQTSKVLFVFSFSTQLDSVIRDYISGRLELSASLLLANLRNLKSVVSNINYMDVNEINKIIEQEKQQSAS